MTDPWTLIERVGFPAVVVLILLIRLEPRIERLSRALEQMVRAMAKAGYDPDEDESRGQR